MFFKKSQSSLEFLIIFGIGFSLILIIGGIFMSFFFAEKQNLDTTVLNQIGERITSSIEKIFFLGIGNKMTLDFKFPEMIHNISIYHKNNLTNPNKSFDYLNISYYYNENISYLIFLTSKNYVRFNCSGCYHNFSSNISYFNDSSDFSVGDKKLKIESFKDYVNIGFVK